MVGIHAAADTEADWHWYRHTLYQGASFSGHPDNNQGSWHLINARLAVETPNDPIMSHFGSEVWFNDEWYTYHEDPRGKGNMEILAVLDRTSYDPNLQGRDHSGNLLPANYPIIFKNTQFSLPLRLIILVFQIRHFSKMISRIHTETIN